MLATVDQAEVDRHYRLAKRVWSLSYAPQQRPRVFRKTLGVDEAFAVGIMAVTVAPFVLLALGNLMPRSGLPQVSVGWLWPGGMYAAALAVVPWLAGRVVDVVAQRTDRRLWWRLHGILEPAGFASLYVVSGMLGFIGMSALVEWLTAFLLPVAAVVMALLCGFFGAVALRSVSNESLRRFLGWIIPLGLTALIPFAGDHLLSVYLLSFGLAPTDVKVGLSDMVLSGAVGVGLLLLAMVFVVAAWGVVRRMGASAASTAPFAVALLLSVALLVPYAGIQAYLLPLNRAADRLPWFGVAPTSVCIHPVERDKPVPFEGTPPPFDRPVVVLGHADGRYALWDPQVRLPSKVISSAVSLVPGTSCRGTGA
ncbi:hypothetical protein LZ318_16150 [Saccharopolyspora indica]|uniref:hypothetical protein n=1 Tax=Saccharopolyspora indica TaxID=1229659 RepID=UPI0022EA8F53|nr:hypothetical protein [Saccharopolyspora indica]MDA3645886.1 hypothetical protein [Saccharopolyspora indica]